MMCSDTSPPPHGGQIVYLNVGGSRFCTSRETLTSVAESFFTSLLAGDIPTCRDDTGAIFIDRDPKLFRVILNYMRSRDLDVSGVSLESLQHEAQYYGLQCLVRQLSLCKEMELPGCGGLFFHCLLPPAVAPSICSCRLSTRAPRFSRPLRPHASCTAADVRAQGGRLIRGVDGVASGLAPTSGVSADATSGHSRANSLDLDAVCGHQAELRLKMSSLDGTTVSTDYSRVRLVRGHYNWIVVAYERYIVGYCMRDSHGGRVLFTSPLLTSTIDLIAVNAKLPSAGVEGVTAMSGGRMVAAACGDSVLLWALADDDSLTAVGEFALGVRVEQLFFIGAHLVALSSRGRMGVWHAGGRHWRCQDIVAVSSCDHTGSVLLLGGVDGSIYYIDMQKFPLRMKDNDLLVTELYHDISGESITAISVYLTSKTTKNGNWIEIAYGTAAGVVRVIVQHPETVGSGPQLFQTFSVHRSPIVRVSLSENYLISVCSVLNHARSWSVTRFRGMISTQPGSHSLASFQIVGLQSELPQLSARGRCCIQPYFNTPGPYGEQDDEQVFVQQVVADSDQLLLRKASDGRRVCKICSVDGSAITAFTIHECESSSRMANRPRRYLITGHSDGSLQLWDLSTALERCSLSEKTASAPFPGGPTPAELLKLLESHNLTEESPESQRSLDTPVFVKPTCVSTDRSSGASGRSSYNTDV